MDTLIYLDNNATTPLGTHARQAMMEGLSEWGNPSSAHRLGRKAREVMEKARDSVAKALSAKPSEIIFTSGGSEANGLALMGSYFSKGDHFRLLTSSVEHSSVRDLTRWLEGRGVEVRALPINRQGTLDLVFLEEQLKNFRPHLVSVMAANNETGVIYPIPEIAARCHAAGALLHTDAVQALGKLPASHWTSADMVSVSAHKIRGPKGIGALVLKGDPGLFPTHFGGSQETKRRGGTENTPGIIGFSAACDAEIPSTETLAQVETLRDRLERLLVEQDSEIEIIAKSSPRLGNTSCLRVVGIPSEILLGILDMQGIAVSAGSACSSGSISPSPVLLAMGLTREEAKECLRVSLGPSSTAEEVDTFVKVVISHIHRIRSRKRS